MRKDHEQGLSKMVSEARYFWHRVTGIVILHASGQIAPRETQEGSQTIQCV